MRRIPVVSLRMVRERSVPYQTKQLVSAEAVFELFRELGDCDREAFWVACLDVKSKITHLSQIAVGSLSAAVVHPREVFKVALLANASAVIFIHNHPSGEVQPSQEDRALTSRLIEAAKLLSIRVIDHVIIGDGQFYSFADMGQLN